MGRLSKKFSQMTADHNVITCRYILKFYSKCAEIYNLEQAHFLSAPGFTGQACLKKT